MVNSRTVPQFPLKANYADISLYINTLDERARCFIALKYTAELYFIYFIIIKMIKYLMHEPLGVNPKLKAQFIKTLKNDGKPKN